LTSPNILPPGRCSRDDVRSPPADFSPSGFSDYYDCARIRIRGGAPLTSAHQPVFRPGGSVPEAGENRDRCLAHVNRLNMTQRREMKMMKVCERASAHGLGLALFATLAVSLLMLHGRLDRLWRPEPSTICPIADLPLVFLSR